MGTGNAANKISGDDSHKHRGINGGGWVPASPTAMRIVSWNARGMGNDQAFREAKKILQLHRPQIMFLCETKLLSGQMQDKGKALKFENCLAVSRNGLSGGLALL